MTLDGIPVRITTDAPLTRRARDGSIRPALCWQGDGEILVHPARWEEFRRAFEVEE